MKKMLLGSLMFGVLVLGLGGCGSDEGTPGPCDGVTCSGHGTCQVIRGVVGVCACDQGWERDPIDDLACVEANPAFVVDQIAALSDPVDSEITVTLKTASPIILVTGSALADVWADILAWHLEQHKAIAADIDPVSREILDVYGPLESPLVALRPTADAVEVELVYSAAIHTLLRSHPRFQAFYDFLQAALDSGDAVLVTEDDTRHEIIDVRAPIAP